MVQSDNRKSSKKRRKSIERRSTTSSSKRSDTASILKETSQEGSASVPLESEKPKINYQDELVLVFFNSMLDNIIGEWITIPDEPPVVCVCPKEDATTKDFKDLLSEDLQHMKITDVQGSALSLTKKGKLKRSSSSSRSQTGPSKRDSTTKGKKPKSSDQSLSPVTSLKQSSKNSDLRKSRTSSRIDISGLQPSGQSLDWLLNPPDENVIIKFKNGNCYQGPVSKKLMHGLGKFIWADGAIYEGEFIHGDATGKGTLQYPDLTFYSGNFCKSLLHGEGVFNISSTTMIYSGNWKAGEKHGEGWLLYEPGNWYQGEWYEDKRQGVGLRQYKTGEKYQGKWYQGKQHGQGTFVWQNNDLYRGEWSNGNMHGYGEYTWNAFLNETFTFPLENTYQGTWIDGARDGVGIMNFGTEGGAKLAGIWECNKKHGAGVMVCGNGTIILRNPLFWFDKPIHLDTEADSGYPVASFKDPNISQIEIQKTVSVQKEHYKEYNKSALQLIAEQVHSKSGSKKFSSQVLENIAVNQERTRSNESLVTFPPLIKSRPDFPTGKVECSPLHIPVHLAPEQIDFSYYTNLAVQKYTALLYKVEIIMNDKETENVNVCGGIKIAEGFPSTVSKYSKWNMSTHYVDLSKTFHRSPENTTQSSSESESRLLAFQEVQTQIEEKHLRNAIIAHLPKLCKFYDKYATIASTHALSFKPILIRHFLWQMLRDLGILDRKYTLIDMDIILIQNPGSGLESEHYPFEKIYFWQFLQILITLAWFLHSPSDVTEECKRFGILTAIFTKFLTEIIYNNVEFTFACSLFEYRDLLPINSIYLLYRSLGEPHTARKFLCNVCTKKKEHPPCYLKIFEDEETPKPIRGINAVAAGGNILFLPEDSPDIGEKPEEPDPDPPVDDPFRKELFALRSLGPKKVVQCLVNVCPQIANEGLIVNMDYSLTFIEFYETLLMCAFMIVDEDKKREERIRLREEKKKLLDEFEQNELESKSVLIGKFGKGVKEKKKAKPK